MFHIDTSHLTILLSGLAALLLAAHLLGYIAELLYIPKVIGEVAGGLVFGPTCIGYFFPDFYHSLFLGFNSEGELFGLIYQLGLILLMFHTGLKFHSRFKREDGTIAFSLIAASTTLPFLAGWFFTLVFDPMELIGEAGSLIPLQIIVAISIAVTSIPVISKIFTDLGISHSRFAKIVIGVAGIHDILLWVALAAATGMVSAGTSNSGSSLSIFKSMGITFAFLIVCIAVIPWLLKRLTALRANLLYRSSFIGYFIFVLLLLSAASGFLGVDVMYGALMAGIAIKLAFPEEMCARIENSIRGISFSFFIPLYFAIVGLGLNLIRDFDPLFFLGYFVFAVLVQGLVVYLACRIIRCDRLTSLNFAITMNARGGPGIVLGTVTYSLGIINERFYTILIVLALVTSWLAGSWLKFVLKRGLRLMPGDEHLSLAEGQQSGAVYHPMPLKADKAID